MADGDFLPEEDREFLKLKSWDYRLLSEDLGNGEVRRGIEFQEFSLPPNLHRRDAGGVLVPGGKVSLLILIPKGYAKARLDSWYFSPSVYLSTGLPADRADGEMEMFGQKWQFWSRHLAENEWRDGIDGLETYLQYVQAGLRDP